MGILRHQSSNRLVRSRVAEMGHAESTINSAGSRCIGGPLHIRLVRAHYA
jgi:hypothetical protein